MPHANAKEAFVWQAAAGPERARLLGAIAIALSSGCLGMLLGRWSVEPTPGQPPSRTAALIEAVSKETQAKAVGAARPEDEARPPAPTAERPAPEATPGPAPEPASGPASEPAPEGVEGNASTTAGGQPPTAAPAAAPGQLTPATPRPPTALPAAEGQLASEAVAPARKPAIAAEHRSAHRPANIRRPARDYRALRDDLLSR